MSSTSIPPPKFSRALCIGEFKQNFLVATLLSVCGIGLICPIVMFIVNYIFLDYLFDILGFSIYLLLAAGGVSLLKVAVPYCRKFLSDFFWARAITRAEDISIEEPYDIPGRGTVSDTLRVNVIDQQGSSTAFDMDDNMGRQLFGQHWITARETIGQKRALSHESRKKFKDYQDLKNKIVSLLIRQGYESYDIEIENTVLLQMEADYFSLLVSQQYLLHALSQSDNVEDQLTKAYADIQHCQDTESQNLYRQTIQLIETRVEQRKENGKLLRNVELELQALESKLALMQDAALTKGHSLRVTEKTYISSPLLLELKEMISTLPSPKPPANEPTQPTSLGLHPRIPLRRIPK